MDPSLTAAFKTVFVVVAALLPILNPPGTAPVFLAMTHGATPAVRAALARRIALNVLCMLVAAMFVGSFVLEFFGISIPVVRVAGGLLVCATAWQLLTAADPLEAGDARAASGASFDVLSQRAFYPLTFPITCGPGSIAVAITLGATLQSSKIALLHMSAAVLGAVLLAATVFVCLRYAERLLRPLGKTGTTVFLRLMAFVLLCIGVQILWTGVAELLEPWKAAQR
ncbi:MAG: NAAT family transporter [Burkholderiales bacterium]|nr:NAAT family transporter [Burkholderiales bacterium]